MRWSDIVERNEKGLIVRYNLQELTIEKLVQFYAAGYLTDQDYEELNRELKEARHEALA